MSAIATEQRQYLTYILTDEATGAQVEIVPERGGIVTSWQINGQEIFYLDKERFTDPTLTVRDASFRLEALRVATRSLAAKSQFPAPSLALF